MSSRHWVYLVWSQRAEASRTQEQSRLARGAIWLPRREQEKRGLGTALGGALLREEGEQRRAQKMEWPKR